MPKFPIKPTLSDLQRYVYEIKIERGFSTTDKMYDCLLLGEEVGELFKAVRKGCNGTIADDSVVSNISDELADCLIFLLSIADMHKIDLETALRTKEEKNKKRIWRRSLADAG